MLKPDMRMIWANSGDVVTPPESKVDLGWILEKPPSQYFNWHLNRTDRMLNHINRRGIPSWSSDTEYHTNGIASYVVGSNGRVYVSVAPSGNNTSPAKDPTTDTTREFWKPAFVGWDEAIPESQITGLTTKLNSKVDKTQRVNTSNGLSGGGALSGNLTIRPTYGTTANTVTQGNDPRLSDSREWSAATVGEAEAKAGTATTRRAWTAQRVHQAADGWYDKKFSTIVKNILSRSNAQQIRNDLQLGTAATRDVGTESGNVMEVGAFGLGRRVSEDGAIWNESDKRSGFFRLPANSDANPFGTTSGASISWIGHGAGGHLDRLLKRWNDERYYFQHFNGTEWGALREILHTGNILKSTGDNDNFPMSQKAVTDAINNIIVAPIGMCYTQYPDTETPSSLFGGTWTLMFNTEGVFFRTEGQGASSFGSGVQGDAIRNITGWFDQRTYFSEEYLVGHNRSALFTSSRDPNVAASVPNAAGAERRRARLTFDASKVVPTSSENRPRNRTIRVWRKTAH